MSEVHTDAGRGLAAGVVRWLMRGLALVGLVLSVYLLIQALAQQPVAGCGPGSSCGKVLGSRWSVWLGLPVSFLSAAVYATALAALVFVGPRRPARARWFAWCTLVVVATAIAAAATWFLAIQVFGLGAICWYCVGVHGMGLALAGLIFASVVLERHGARRLGGEAEGGAPGVSGVRGCIAIGLLAGLALMAGQALYEPAGYRYEAAPGAAVEGGQPRTSPATTATTTPATSGSVHLLNGQLAVEKDGAPVLGSADAPQVIALFFDYTCEYCREMHHQLEQARQRYGSQLGILSIVVPNEARCNPTVAITEPKHRGACEYARLSLAVWLYNPAAYAEFDGWLIAGPGAPGLEIAREYAARLLPGGKLEAALADRRIDGQLERHFQWQRQTGTELIPLMAAPRGKIVGRVPSMSLLLDVFENKMGLKPLAGETHSVD